MPRAMRDLRRFLLAVAALAAFVAVCWFSYHPAAYHPACSAPPTGPITFPYHSPGSGLPACNAGIQIATTVLYLGGGLGLFSAWWTFFYAVRVGGGLLIGLRCAADAVVGATLGCPDEVVIAAEQEPVRSMHLLSRLAPPVDRREWLAEMYGVLDGEPDPVQRREIVRSYRAGAAAVIAIAWGGVLRARLTDYTGQRR